MTDTGGTLLHSLASGMSDVSGVTLVTGGAFADHLALSDQVARTVDFLTLDGAPAGAFSTSSFGANEPSGVAYIGSTATGVYDDMLAVTSNADDSVSIVNQTGALQTAFTMTVPGGEKVTDVAHLPGADKLLVAFDTIQRIYDFDGNQLREYSTSSFGASKVRGAAIQPLTCEHVIVDKDLTEVKYLDQGASLLSVLQVVGDAAALDSRDAGRKALMEAWGYTVNVIDDSDSQASFDAASVAADVVLVTGSVVGATFGSKLTSSTTGVVNELPDALDDFGFSSSTTAAVNADGFTITDGAHYITEPFSGNPVTVFTASMLMSMPSGVLAPDLQNAGEITGNAALVTLDTGALRYDNTASPSRRVHLPFSAAETSELNADAESVLQRALEWAAGAGGGGGSGSGPAGVVFEEFTDAKANAAQNLTISKPPGTVAGDLLITAVVTDGGTSSAMNPPSGWNLIDLDETGSSVTFGVWWKLATASESGSYTFSWDGGEKVFGMVMRFSGHDPVNPIHASSSDGGNSSAPAVPAVTTTVADAMILRLGGFDDDDVTVGAPGLAGHTAITMDISGNGSGTSSAGAGYTTQAVPGSSGTASFTLTASEQYRTVTIAIAPAP
jgi:hypothetical protein